VRVAFASGADEEVEFFVGESFDAVITVLQDNAFGGLAERECLKTEAGLDGADGVARPYLCRSLVAEPFEAALLQDEALVAKATTVLGLPGLPVPRRGPAPARRNEPTSSRGFAVTADAASWT